MPHASCLIHLHLLALLPSLAALVRIAARTDRDSVRNTDFSKSLLSLLHRVFILSLMHVIRLFLLLQLRLPYRREIGMGHCFFRSESFL